jgi:hypothetical protein
MQNPTLMIRQASFKKDDHHSTMVDNPWSVGFNSNSLPSLFSMCLHQQTTSDLGKMIALLRHGLQKCCQRRNSL